MTTRRVWDPAVRVLHWALVTAFALGWVTTMTPRLGAWHQSAGYVALAMVAARIAWGFVGTRYARFAQFVRGPQFTFGYARLFVSGREPRYLGHNPLGACMVIALLGCFVALTLTGWLYTTDRFWGDESVERVHLAIAWTTLALAALHVAGVTLASFRHRENLVAAMFTGMKRDADEADIA